MKELITTPNTHCHISHGLESKLSNSLVLLFAVACGLSVANVYYAQPLLDALSLEFSISNAAIGSVITLTQIGCALALLFLVPLGDKIERKKLMLLQLVALVISLIVVGMAKTPMTLMIGMLAVGMLGTAMTQGLIAYAASSSSLSDQGRVIGTAQSGVFIGLLLSRTFSGLISDLVGWRGVYICSAILMLSIAYPLSRRLPNLIVMTKDIKYHQLIFSLFYLLKEQKVLQVRGLLALLMFAAFNIFWSAIVIPLSDAPFNYSRTVIGSLGLVGAIGALVASKSGGWADRGYGKQVSFYALVILILAWFPISLISWSIWALIVGIILLDAGGQALHVTNQSMIYRTKPEANSRMISLYMMFYAIGSGLGAISSTAMYAYAGWNGVCILGALVSVFALIIWGITRNRSF
ncbi:MFS transporter [Providencia vermicola]|uniref:MFS transporter n=1 Tax=Providencia vermicola TaxID=333965 RepID=UPI0034DCF213